MSVNSADYNSDAINGEQLAALMRDEIYDRLKGDVPESLAVFLCSLKAQVDSLQKIVSEKNLGECVADSINTQSLKVGGVDVSPSDHTHQVKINGVTKTIAKTGGDPVDLGTYLTQHQSLANCIQKSQTSGLVKNDGTIDTNKKVDVANIKLDDYSGKILAKVQAMAATDGNDYARFYTTGDNVAANITDKPESGNKGFVCEVIRQRGTSSSDYRFHLICLVQASTNPYVAVVTQETTEISWSRLNTDTTYSQISRGSGAGLAPGLPSGSGTSKYLREDGLWETPPDTTYGTFSNSQDGLVPSPGAYSDKILKSNGTWDDWANSRFNPFPTGDTNAYCVAFRSNTSYTAGSVTLYDDTNFRYAPSQNLLSCNISGSASKWNGLSLSFGSFSTADDTISVV